MRRAVLLIAVVMVCATGATGALSAQDNCGDNTPFLATELGAREGVLERLSTTPQVVTSYPSVPQKGARYIRVEMSVESPPDCEWFLSVRDRDYRLVQTLGRESNANPPRWTFRISGDRALFDLQPCPDGKAPTVRFVGYIWMPDQADQKRTYYSTQTRGKEQWKELTQAETQFRRLGDVTGLLMGSFTRQSWSCTGVMITPDLFLTNWHCGGPAGVLSEISAANVAFPVDSYWSRPIWQDILIDLSWDNDRVSRELTVVDVPVKSQLLDFAILRISAVDRLGPIRPAKIAPGRVAANDRIRVVHHPAGRVKQLSWNCTVSDPQWAGWQDAAVRSEFSHVCDTEAGSSGAPIFNERNELVGIHHLGFAFDSTKCEYRDHVNKAVAISDILENVRTAAPNVHAEIMKWQ